MIDVLERELDRHDAIGRAATLWWRDDDACTDTPELRTLLALAGEFRVPVALAAIPACADSALAAVLAQWPEATVIQHGYAHRNHAVPGERSAELAAGRDLASTLAELEDGRVQLAARFGARFVPVLVPPWNRVADALLPNLAGVGFIGLSRFGPRNGAFVVPALREVNAHVDPIAWRRNRAFIGVAAAIERIVSHLAARRMGSCDPDEPTGLLTHHLVLTDEAWHFVRDLLACTAGHRAARWVSVPDLFAIGRAASPVPHTDARGRVVAARSG